MTAPCCLRSGELPGGCWGTAWAAGSCVSVLYQSWSLLWAGAVSSPPPITSPLELCSVACPMMTGHMDCDYPPSSPSPCDSPSHTMSPPLPAHHPRCLKLYLERVGVSFLEDGSRADKGQHGETFSLVHMAALDTEFLNYR